MAFNIMFVNFCIVFKCVLTVLQIILNGPTFVLLMFSNTRYYSPVFKLHYTLYMTLI